MIEGLDDVEKFGIDLKLQSYEEEVFYTTVLRQWFEDIKGYYTHPVNEMEFDLSFGDDPVATVYIEHSILRMRAIKDDPYEILICLLEFIADNHKKTIQAYNYLEEEGKSSLSDYEEGYRPSGQELHDIVKDYMDNEEESDDDSDDEWI